MKFILSLCFLIAGASAVSLKLRDDLGWESCSDNNWGSGNVDLSPYPFPLVEGTKVDVSFAFDLLNEVDGDVDLDIKLVKKGLVSIPIPCTEVCHGVYIGSCSYKLEELLTKYCKYIKPYFPNGQECSFPLMPGNYAAAFENLNFPGVSAGFAAIAQGKFKAQISAKRNGEEIFCIGGELKLVK